MKAVSVYTEITPNPASMKFVADIMLVNDGIAYEFKDPDEVKNAPLLAKLFNFPFVEGLFVSRNFITVTKNNLVAWEDVSTELREYVQDYLRNNDALFIAPAGIALTHEKMPQDHPLSSQEIVLPQNETEQRIFDILEEYVKPAVDQDGGAIEFRSYQDGILKVAMKGSCSGCPSSSVTLKAGIQQLFNKMMPEVKEVVAEEV